MKNMKRPGARAPILNELILSLRLHAARRRRRRRRISVELDNCPRRDLPFMRAIAAVVAIWYSRNWEENDHE